MIRNHLNTIFFIFLVSLFFYSACRNSEQNEKKIRHGAKYSTGTVGVGGTKLKYVVEGRGQTCLVIGSSIYYPRTFSQELRNHLKMFFVDMPWFAEEYVPVDPREYTIQSTADDIETIRSSLGLDRVLLMGHSIHGTIAFEYARRYPDYVTGVILIGSPNIFGNEAYDLATRDFWKTATNKRIQKQRRNWEELAAQPPLSGGDITIGNYIAMAPKYWYDPDYDARWLWKGMTVNQDLIEHLYGTIFADYNMFGSEKRVPVPSLVILGKYDYVVPFPIWQDLDSITDLTLKLFEKSGHTPQLEEPGMFNAVVLEWLEKNIPSN